MPAHQESPPGIDLARHAELAGRSQYWWWRRVALVLIAAVPIVGLFNVFGQQPQATRAATAQAGMVVTSPSRVRGGLMFTTEITVKPHQDIPDAQLHLNTGWFRNMTFNGVSPQPSTFKSVRHWQVWDFGAMQAGQPSTIVISWQTNPTNVGTRPETLALYNGNQPIMTIHRTLTVFP